MNDGIRIIRIEPHHGRRFNSHEIIRILLFIASLTEIAIVESDIRI